ncbi:MAG TPA: hypothetical protein VH987_00735 [Candidatus Limnocylindria bacterium]|jgi:hypothetical protein
MPSISGNPSGTGGSSIWVLEADAVAALPLGGTVDDARPLGVPPADPSALLVATPHPQRIASSSNPVRREPAM